MIRRLLTALLLCVSAAHAGVADHAASDVLAAEAARLAPAFTPTAQQILPPTPQQMQGLGSWSSIISWTPHIPVTCAQLPDGRLLTFASNQRTTFPNGPEFTYAATWDYRTGAFVEYNNPRHDMFCGGVALLPDGRVIVNGGRNTTVLSSIFDWRTNTWSALPNMQDPRWYNTTVVMPNGTAFTASGSGGSNTAERWQDGVGWTRLPNINWALAHSEGGLESIWHPFLHVAPDGRIAHTGPTDSMHWVDPTGSGKFIDTGVKVPGNYYPKDGVLVMYDIGKILHAAGRDLVTGASKLAYTIDINGPAPVPTRTGDVINARTFANGVLLPNGEVMMIGGNNSQEKFSDTGSILTPEIWNPTSGTWRIAANASVPRNYHSLAVLLPDGRVWSGGGGLSGNAADHRDAQIYTPGALYNADGSLATRPAITAAPDAIGPGMAFSVKATSGMRNFTFIKLAALTHSVGTDLRFLNLPFTEDTAGNYTVHSHVNLNVMTPGYWMLFAISPTGPYSVSKIIKVDAALTYGIGNPGDQTSVIGTAATLTLSSTGYNAPTRVYSATGLPNGLTINASTGIISGTPSATGVFNVTATVSDGIKPAASAVFKWTVQSTLALLPLSGAPSPVNTAVTFTANSTGGLNPQYKWNFGDGSAETAYSTSKTAAKTYTTPGRYIVTLTAKDATGREVSTSFRQAVHAVLTAAQPTVSTSIAYQARTGANALLWVVNPDQDNVAVFDAVTRVRSAIIPVGAAPRSIAIAPDGRAWVVNSDSASISIIGTNLALAQTITLARGSRPYAIVFDPAGNNAYVSLQDTGSVLKISRATLATLATATVGSDVRHLSVNADGTKVFATRFITPRLPGEENAVVTTQSGAVKYGGQVAVITAATMAVAKTIILEHSNDTDSSIAGRGIPNYLGPAVLSPDGRTAWVPSKKDNIKRGLLRDGQLLTHDSAVRSITSRIDLTTEAEDFAARIDYNDAGIASTACFERTGMYAFAALEGSREIAVIDSFGKREMLRFTAGRAPQGVVTSPDGRTLFVHNFMDRSVTVHDVSAIINGAEDAPVLTATLSTIATEKLAAGILKGKQFFYDSRDQRIALQQYVSCAACHNDGGQDGRVWDFTGFGEGLRNNITLRGHGTHGPAHWTGNFDEIQDFEGQIRGFAGGLGLMTDADFHNGTRDQPLGTPKAGVSADLDALAAYVTSLTTTGNSPYRTSAGALTADATAGQTLFKAQNCAACHSGVNFTNSALNVFANIGTIKPSSGKRLNGTLTGFDVPTLRGLWNTAPYLHDGRAATLAEAVSAHQGIVLNATQLTQLTAYLQQIEDSTMIAPAPLQIVLSTPSTNVNTTFAVTGFLSELATGFTASDFNITGGIINDGYDFLISGSSFKFNVTPTAATVQISVPVGKMTDSLGVPNLASNVLTITNSGDVTKPGLTLATASTSVSSAFNVTVTATENVSGLALTDFVVTNGTASALTGSGSSYGVTITPTAAGAVTVQLPAAAVADTAGNTSTASNLLSVTYTPVVTPTVVRLQAEDFDQGGEGVAYHDTEVENFGYSWGGFFYRAGGVDIEPSEDTDGTPSVAWTDAGEWLKYTTNLSPGTYEMNLRAATNPAGPFRLRVLVNGAVAATFNVTASGGWNTFRTFTLGGINLTASGASTVRVEFLDGNINFNWLELKNTTAGPDTTKPSVQLATAATSVTAPFTVSATFSENVTGVALGDFTVTNGTASAFSGSGSAYSILVTPAANGAVTIAMPANAAADAAGNTSTASNVLSVNYTAPADPKPTVVLSTTSTTVTGNFTVSAQFSENVTGLLASEFTVINGSVTGLSGAGSLWTATVQPTASGVVSVGLPANVAQDSAGQGNILSNTLSVNYAPVTRQNGITADYFAGINFDQLRFSRIDSKIDFQWAAAAPDARLPSDSYSVRWHGCVIPRVTGTHSFTTMSDDGVRLWVNDRLIVDNWTNHGESWDTGDIDLQAGVPVVIKMEYYEASGDAVARLWWEAPGQPFEVIPVSNLLINENGMNAAPYPATFAEWLASPRSNGNKLNADGDDTPDLLEYALGSAAGSGVSTGEALVIQNGIASVTKAISISDLRWFLESTADLKAWTALNLTPVATDNKNGTETLRWTLPADAAGIIRLRVQLLGGTDTAASPPVAWSTLILTTGTQSVGVQIVNAPIYTGLAHSISGSSVFLSDASYLPAVAGANARHYLEIRNGPLAGHRFDLSLVGDRVLVIDAASPRNTQAALPATLTGIQIAVHRHVTLAQIFDKAVLKGSNSSTTADQVNFLENGVFRSHWLYQAGTGKQWTASGDATLGSSDATIIAPGTGVLFKSALSTARRLVITGRVRTTPFAVRIAEGNQFLTPPWPLAASPDRLAMISGFIAASNANTADTLQLWTGDATAGASGYTGLWLFKNSITGAATWAFATDSSLRSQNAALLFPATRAFFLKPAPGTRAAWTIPAP